MPISVQYHANILSVFIDTIDVTEKKQKFKIGIYDDNINILTLLRIINNLQKLKIEMFIVHQITALNYNLEYSYFGTILV